MATSPDPIDFAQDLIASLLPGTDAAGWPVRADNLEPGDAPVRNGVGLFLLQEAGGIRAKNGLPAWNPYRVLVKAFGLDGEQAAKGLRIVSDLLHGRGPVTTPKGRLWKAFDETGPQLADEPDTDWAVRFAVFDLHITTQPAP